MEAIKLNVTFNSLSGDDVVIGSNYPRLKARVQADVMFNEQPDVSSANPVSFLVEADSFKKDGDKDNLIELSITDDIATSQISESGELSGAIHKVSTGDRAYQTDATDQEFTHTYLTPTLDIDSNDIQTVFSE